MKKKLSLEIGSYEGEVNKKDEPHGKGVLSNPSEFTKYIGEFVNGKKHGKGIYHYSTGGKYKGEWIHDKKHGYGVI